MFGAIAGDIIGSAFENAPIKSKDFHLFSPASRFTDDTVLTLAVAEALLTHTDYASVFRSYYRRYPDRGYGPGFRHWVSSSADMPAYSFGNGSAMRISPVGWAFMSLPEVLDEAGKCAAVTHNHAEGIRGAQAVAGAIFLARTGCSKTEISYYISTTFSYDLDRTLDSVRPTYAFDMSCDGSVPEAIIAFLEAGDFEEAVRNAISLGGDSDTMACIAGAIAEAYYQDIDPDICTTVINKLPENLVHILQQFRNKYLPDVNRHDTLANI